LAHFVETWLGLHTRIPERPEVAGVLAAHQISPIEEN
jgi:hypothetical protein